jgi:hypothetical protein
MVRVRILVRTKILVFGRHVKGIRNKMLPNNALYTIKNLSTRMLAMQMYSEVCNNQKYRVKVTHHSGFPSN